MHEYSFSTLKTNINIATNMELPRISELNIMLGEKLSVSLIISLKFQEIPYLFMNHISTLISHSTYHLIVNSTYLISHWPFKNVALIFF